MMKYLKIWYRLLVYHTSFFLNKTAFGITKNEDFDHKNTHFGFWWLKRWFSVISAEANQPVHFKIHILLDVCNGI